MNGRRSEGYLKSLIVSWVILFTAFFCVTFFSVTTFAAEEQYANPPLVGVVTKLSLDEGFLVVKSEEGKRSSVFVTGETLYKGVFLPEEINVKQNVKVWYELEEGDFKALKIEVKPELGC